MLEREGMELEREEWDARTRDWVRQLRREGRESVERMKAHGYLYYFRRRRRCVETRIRVPTELTSRRYIWLYLIPGSNICQFVLLTRIVRSYRCRRSYRFGLSDFGSTNRYIT